MAASFRMSVEENIDDMLRDLNHVQKKLAPAAAARALNKAATVARKESTRAISNRRGITPQRLVRDRLRIAKSHKSRLTAYIYAKLHPVRAIEMATSERGGKRARKGIKSGPNIFHRAFLAYRGKKKYGVYERQTREQFPIVERVIKLLPQADSIIRKIISTSGLAAFKKEFERQMALRMRHKGMR